jgi:hypothetical protein
MSVDYFPAKVLKIFVGRKFFAIDEVIQNMTQPIHLKPFFPGENMTQVEGPISQIAQYMVRMEK